MSWMDIFDASFILTVLTIIFTGVFVVGVFATRFKQVINNQSELITTLKDLEKGHTSQDSDIKDLDKRISLLEQQQSINKDFSKRVDRKIDEFGKELKDFIKNFYENHISKG